jgi:putative oxidoreductase
MRSRPTNKNLGTAAATRAAEETFLSNQVSERNYSGVAGWSLIPLRLVLGYGFMVHGWAKWSRGPAGFARLLEQIGVPFPNVSAWVVTLLELFGGFAILAGALIAVVSIPLIVSLLVAMVTVHLKYGFSSINTIGLTPSGPVFGPPGFEVDLLYIAGLLVLTVNGPGKFSVDWLLAQTRRKRFANGLNLNPPMS